jgi:haloalkane dehalogenase
MKILRTPDACFAGLKDYPFEPCYTVIKTKDGSNLRIHHIDEGPRDGPVLLAMHGQPVWSYLYSKMIPFLTDAGVRVIAPDLPGYGKSDKPAAREDYSYQNQVDWMVDWLIANDFQNLTFFGQDWGGLIGLRMVAREPDRFMGVSMGNTGLPYNPDATEDVIQRVNAFRESDERLTVFSMFKQVMQMDQKETAPALKFMYWQKFCWDTVDLPIGFIASQQMERPSMLRTLLNYLFVQLGKSNASPFRSAVAKAFDAPFPDASYKMGPRAMPSHVPTIPDASLAAQREARAFFGAWNKPFLSVFAGDDPVTNGIESDVLAMCPNAVSAPHIGGGHFYQWRRPEALSQLLAEFTKANQR